MTVSHTVPCKRNSSRHGMLLLLVLTMGILESCRSEVFVVGDEPDGWKVTGTFPDLEAVVGDVLTFEYSTAHTVVSPVEKSCDFEGKTDLAGVGDSPFNLTLSEPGTIHIACDIPGHCPQGMLFTVVVKKAESKASSEVLEPMKGGKKMRGRKKSKKGEKEEEEEVEEEKGEKKKSKKSKKGEKEEEEEEEEVEEEEKKPKKGGKEEEEEVEEEKKKPKKGGKEEEEKGPEVEEEEEETEEVKKVKKSKKGEKEEEETEEEEVEEVEEKEEKKKGEKGRR